MKQVRYLAGAAGLAPAALGMTTPAPAHPAAAVPVAAEHAKTVSLPVRGDRAAVAAAASSASPSSVSPATGGCVTPSKSRIFAGDRMLGNVSWWAGPKNRCLTDVHVSFTPGPDNSARCLRLDLEISTNPHHQGKIVYDRSVSTCASYGHKRLHTFDVNERIPASKSISILAGASSQTAPNDHSIHAEGTFFKRY